MSVKNKILVVDDDPVNLDFFYLMLSKLGFDVWEATDGLDALKKLEKLEELDSIPDIILLDNIMPRMSGWELAKTLKEDSRYRDISIIMFSALDDVKDKQAGFELGVDDYITKPFNFSEVLARIRSILQIREFSSKFSNVRQTFLDAERSMGDLHAAIKTMFSWLDTSGVQVPIKISRNILNKAEKAREIIEAGRTEMDNNVDQ